MHHNQSYNEQNREGIQDSRKSDMIQEEKYSSFNNSEIDDIFFDDDPFCSNNDYKSFMYDNEVYRPMNLDDNYYHLSRSKSDSEVLPSK